MSLTEILIIVAGAAIGYWVVSLMMEKKRPARPESAPGSESRPPDPPDPQPGPRPWHEVLGVAPEASPAGIRTAYRSLMSQYHPDKVASLGPELRELAERKSREITQAYREVMRAHGDDA